MDIDEIPAGLRAGERQTSITTRRSSSNAEAMLFAWLKHPGYC
ncbi:hypothetical protein [Arthrobacter sp. MW3 TE3886]